MSILYDSNQDQHDAIEIKNSENASWSSTDPKILVNEDSVLKWKAPGDLYSMSTEIKDGQWDANDFILIEENDTRYWKSAKELINHLKIEIRSALPVKGEFNTLYLIPSEKQSKGHFYDEYLYVQIGNNLADFELVGEKYDLSKYLTIDSANTKYSKTGHKHGNITSDGKIEKNSNCESVIDDRCFIVVSHGDNKEIRESNIHFSNPEDYDSNLYLAKDGSWKEIETGKQIDSGDVESKGWLGNTEIEIPSSMKEIFGYILTGGVQDLSSINTDVLQFSITKQSLNDMFNQRMKDFNNIIPTDSDEKNAFFRFHFNISIPLSYSYENYSYAHTRIQVNIQNIYDAETKTLNWNADKNILCSMVKCNSICKNTIFPGRNEVFDYITGLHTGYYNSDLGMRGFYFNKAGYHVVATGGGETRYTVQKFDESGYITSETAAPTWNGSAWIGNGHYILCYSHNRQGLKFFKGNGNSQQGVNNLKICDGYELISTSQKTAARLFIYYK